MKLKRTFKTLLMIIATVMSVVSGILTDSGTLAYAATTYTLTLNWDDGVEWVATDRNGTDRWEKGGSKTFQAGSKAYTYVRLKNGATVKSFFSRQENKDWTDYTYTSGSLCYDTWTMHNNRNVDIYTSVSSSADVSYDWDNLVTSSKHYHSSNGNEASWSNLRDDLGRSPAPIYSIYYKLQENRYRETCYGDNQEDKDFGGYEIMLRTEDNHNSYWYGQSSYANGNGFDDWYRDEFEGIKLSNLAIVPVQIKGDKFLQINISIKNNNSYAKEISLATCSDIQIADDDNATTFFNGNGFTMTNMYCETSDNFPLGTIPTATLNVYAKDVPGYVTDADAVYIGHFVYRKQHIWLNNVLGDKTTYFNKKPHGGTSGEGESDSGFSIAWKNRTIAAGQTQTYSYIIGIGKYNSDNKITFDANSGELKTPGTNINNPSGNYSNKVTVTYGTDTYSSMRNDIPERAGYIFDGWWTTPNDSNASVMVYDASGKCNNDCNYWKNNQWQGTNDLTVYAHWKANTYTVRLNTGDIPSSELTKLTETADKEGWTWNENGRYFSKAFVQNENNYLPGVNKFFSANNYESVGSKVTDKYFVQDKTKNPTKVLYNWWTSASGGTDIGRGEKTYNNLYEISKDNSGIVNLYPHWMGYTTVFNYSDTAPSNTAGQTVTINNNINDGMDNNLYQVYGNCFFYKGTDGEYHDYEGTNPDLKVTASIPNSNGYKYIFNGWHHKKLNYLTDGLGKLTYKNNYNIGQGKTSYSLSPHFTRTGINYNVRLHANVPENTESTLQVLHRNGISSYIYDSNSRYFSRELTYDDLQDMLSPDVYSLRGYHLISISDWYTEKTGGNTVSAPCNNTKAEYPDWSENYWNLTTTDGATVDLYARWQANNYKIAYNLDGGTYGTSHPTSVDYDTMVTIDNPSKTGYTFAGWTITGYDTETSGHSAATWTGETGASFKNLASTEGKTVTFTAVWNVATANFQTTGDTGIASTSHPNKTSENIGSSINVNAKLNNGYTFAGWYNGSTLVSDKMNFNYTMPNTDTVLTAKTTPAKYTISYDLNGGAVAVSNPTSYNIETPTFTLNNPVRLGYVFVGWTGSNGTTTPQKNVSIYKGSTGNRTYKANWTANTGTKYTVEHYKMNLDGTTYTLADTDNLKGTTDTSVTPAVKTYEGFTSPSTQTVTIKGDGTTVVKYYYTRNKYTLDLNGLINGTLRGNLVDVVKNPITGAEDRHTAGTAVVTVNGTVVGNKVTDYCNEVYYGSSISIITTAESGYSIIDNDNVSFKMPAEGKTVTVTINAKDTKYLVRHWKKNVNTDSKTYNENSLNDSNYTMYDAEYLNGKAYSWVKPVVRTLKGFTYKGVLPSEGTAYVKPDGTTVIDVYYTRNTYTINGGNINANVEYGNGISSVSGLKTYEYEQKVTLTANLKTGYHWHDTDDCISSIKYPTGWYSRNNSGVDGILTDNTTYNSQTIKFNMPARNVKLGVKATNNSYTVVYNGNKPTDPSSLYNVQVIDEIKQEFIYNESQNIATNKFNLAGYTRKDGWMTKPSTDGNGTADYAYGETVINLTDKNLDVINLYAIWEDNAPEEINISSTNDFATTQTVTLTAKDYGSGINYISFGKDEKYEKVTCNADGSVTFTRKVNASGTYIFSVKDKNGKVSKKTITFYQTTLNTNKNNIVSSDGKNVIESDFTSVPETLSTYISINEAGKSITPVTKRNGVDFLGWSTDRKGKTGIISIKADGNKTYYAIWKDTINPLVVITDVSNKDADSQTIKFNLYDLDADLTDKDFEGKDLEYIRKHGEKTGSDIAAYWFGKNPVYNGNGNSRTVTEIVKDEGYSVNLERTVGEANYYYIFAEDKAGNISKTTIAVDANGNVTPNNDLTFCSLTLNANDGLIQENGQNTIQKLIRKGNTYNLTNVHAERTGYHDTESDTDGVSMHWSHEIALGSNIIDEDKQTVIGTDNSVNPESLTEWEAKGNDTLYTKWTPNAYTLKVYLNKPVKATEDINTYNTVSSDTNKWIYDTYTGYYKTVLVYDKVWSIPDSAEFAGLTGWTTTGFKNVGKTGKSDIIYLNSLNRSYDEADDVSKASDIGTNLTSVKGDAVAYTMLWKENRYTVNFRANGGTAVKRVTLLEKKIDGSAKERTVDTTASANKKATDKTYDTSIIIGYESMIKVLDSPVRPGFTFTFFTKDKDYAKTAHMKDDKPDFDKSVLCTGELSEEAAKMYREEYKITGSLNGDEEVNLYSSWSKRKPVTLQSFISANSIRTDANALTKIALGTYITRDNAKDINSAWFNKNYKTNDKGEYVMNDTVEVLQEWDVTKTEIKQTYSKKIMADNN